MRYSFLAMLALMLPLCAGATESGYTVSHVINAKSLTLTNGDIVRLASIEAPNAAEEYGSSGEPLGEEAKQSLARMVEGKQVTLRSELATRDRHNRRIAQVYLGDTWVQGELLKEGYAMVETFNDTPPEVAKAMLAQERSAQSNRRGIWANDYYRIITPEQAGDFINRFKLVEGKVVSVHDSYGNIYINFFEQWKGRFALFISRKYADAFAGSNLQALVGKTIRMRGWIHYHNAPMINLTHPEEIEAVVKD